MHKCFYVFNVETKIRTINVAHACVCMRACVYVFIRAHVLAYVRVFVCMFIYVCV